MLFSYNWLREYIPTKISPQKLSQLLTLQAFEVKSLSQKGKDFVLDIDVLPNRAPDCFSHQGIARELRAILAAKGQIKKIKEVCPKYRFPEDKSQSIKDFLTIKVKNPQDCPRYSARVIRDVKVGNSPSWLQRRLEALGVKPINNIVDITNYVMLDLGQPIHAFDFDKIAPDRQGKAKIIVRRAQNKEKIISLDNKVYQLNPNILVIADTEKPLAIAGIKGGKAAGISKKTRNIALEAANFNRLVVYQGSKTLGLGTDAANRFGSGLSPDWTIKALDLACFLITKIAGGQVAQGTADFFPCSEKPQSITLRLSKIESLLGVEISSQQIIRILKALGCQVKASKNLKALMVRVPYWRLDLNIEQDLIEEIARIYGFGKIPFVQPSGPIVVPALNEDWEWRKKITDFLVGAGFDELYNYSFISEEFLKILQPPSKAVTALTLVNPVSAKRKFLRPSLLPGLLEAVAYNLKYFENLKLFEIGKIFGPERWSLGGAFYRLDSGPEKIQALGFFFLKGVLQGLFENLGMSDLNYQSPPHKVLELWHPGQVAEIKTATGQVLGIIGEVNLSSNLPWKIKRGGLACFELDLELLIRLASSDKTYQAPPRFPAVVQDISLIVEKGIKMAQVLSIIQEVGKDLVEDVDLFDVYEEFQEGKKSLAFHIVYRSPDRTLTDKEVRLLHQKIEKALEEQIGAEIR